jgi:hypothetical protein
MMLSTTDLASADTHSFDFDLVHRLATIELTEDHEVHVPDPVPAPVVVAVGPSPADVAAYRAAEERAALARSDAQEARQEAERLDAEACAAEWAAEDLEEDALRAAEELWSLRARLGL